MTCSHAARPCAVCNPTHAAFTFIPYGTGEEELQQAKSERDAAQAALFRVMHGPENVRALKRIARKFFQGRTPTIVATLEHRTKELEAAKAAAERRSAMNAEEFRLWREGNVRKTLIEQTARFREALMAIAALSDGPVVCGAFDEPGSAEVARKALAAGWIGPCVHGRDPWHRCDECGELDEEVAWAMAAIKDGVR